MSDNIVENRSELLFLYDAVDANPNGNPMSAENKPRVDPETGKAIVTDVRFKRYLRDQLESDGHGVYVKDLNDKTSDRDYLADDIIPDDLEEILRNLEDFDASDDSDDELRDFVDDIEKLESVFEDFLSNASDVRLFGATFSFAGDSEVIGKLDGDDESHFPSNIIGAVQFSPAKSLNTVDRNRESNSLTSVVTTGKDNEQGGFALSDHRIKYGLIPFYGVVNENAAETTGLTEEDVKRLDTLCWRALTNQTLTRSKIGQNPRLYLRAEYSTDDFHIGRLDDYVEMKKTSDDAVRSSRDVVLNVDDLINALSSSEEHVETLHMAGEQLLTYELDGETYSFDELVDEINSRFDSDVVETIDIYSDYTETLPKGSE